MSSIILSAPTIQCLLRYKLEKDPIEVLENDPDLVNRAQAMDVPFEPVRNGVLMG